MTRQAPAQYVLPPLDLDHRPFNRRTLRRILAEARVRATTDKASITLACRHLNRAAQLLLLQQGLALGPTDAGSVKALTEIQQLASKLRAAFPVVYQTSLFGDDNSPGENPSVIHGVARLLMPTMERLMAERVARAKDEHGRGEDYEEIFGARNPADALLMLTEHLDLLAASAKEACSLLQPMRTPRAASPVMRFAASAAKEFLRLTGSADLTSSRSSNGKGAGGPLIRFLEGCCSKVGHDVPAYTLEDWIGRWRAETRRSSQPASGNAIRK